MANEQYVGFLPYGSDDPSVIFADPLTSKAGLEASVTAAGGTLSEEVAISDFDSVLGFRPQAPVASGGNGSEGYLITGMTDQDALKIGGQMTFEIESAFFTMLDSSKASTGYDTSVRSNEPYAISWGATDLSFYMGICVNKSTTAKIPIITRATNTTVSNIEAYHNRREYPAQTGGAYLNSLSCAEFIKVHLYWYRDGLDLYTVMALDDEVIIRRKTTFAVAESKNLFEKIWLGSVISSSNFVNWHAWMRNIQISTRVPALARKESVGKTIYWSDSLFGGPGAGTQARPTMRFYLNGGASTNVSSSAGRYFSDATSGVMSTDCYVYIYGGDSLLGGEPQSANVATVLSSAPDVVVFESGTNDPVDTDIDAWLTEYKSILTSLFSGGVRNVIACTIPSVRYLAVRDTDQWKTQIAGYNAKIATLPAWDSRVKVADIFSAFEGETGSPNYWVGGFTGANDNLHWHDTGCQKAGETIGAVLKQL